MSKNSKNSIANSSSAKIESRIRALENAYQSSNTILGFDKDGKRNGNGLITLVERIDKGQSEIWHRIDILKTDTENLKFKLNEINDNWKELSFNIRTLNANIKNMEEKIKSFESKIEEHTKAIDKSITPNKLRDVAKDFGIFVAFLAGLGTVFGMIAYLYNRIRGHI